MPSRGSHMHASRHLERLRRERVSSVKVEGAAVSQDHHPRSLRERRGDTSLIPSTIRFIAQESHQTHHIQHTRSTHTRSTLQYHRYMRLLDNSWRPPTVNGTHIIYSSADTEPPGTSISTIFFITVCLELFPYHRIERRGNGTAS